MTTTVTQSCSSPDLYLAMDQAGKSRHLIKAVHRVVRSCLNEAVRRRVVSHNPALIARTPRLEPDEVQPLTLADVRRVLAVSASRRNALRWSLAFGHGPRQGEFLGLRWSDVDLETGEVQTRAQLQRQIWQRGCLLKAPHGEAGQTVRSISDAIRRHH